MNYHDAINWIKKAQDIGSDDGIPAFYNSFTKSWMASYPEVSGYTIPTLIEANEPDRALRISRWLRKKQLADGAMPMGYWNSNVPMVFDTGMVLLGWLKAQEVEYDPRTEESIDKAVDYMEKAWFTNRENYLPTHTIRAVWPLKLYGAKYTDSMLDFYQGYIDDNGFPRQCEDQHPNEPLSHFIVYVARGLFECGLTEEARRIMRNLPSVPNARYDSNWISTSDEICIPGVAQGAILFRKLGFNAEAKRARNYLDTLTGPFSTDPIDGTYLPNSQLSWSAKFIADALNPSNA